jgi:hypothetical protein
MDSTHRKAWGVCQLDHVFCSLRIATRFFQTSLFLRTIFATSRHHFYVPYSCVLRYSFSSAINHSFSSESYEPGRRTPLAQYSLLSQGSIPLHLVHRNGIKARKANRRESARLALAKPQHNTNNGVLQDKPQRAS